jgi:hypothetical protein
MRKRRSHAEELADDDAGDHGRKGGRGAPVAQQQQHEGRSDDAKPELFFHQAHAEARER